MFGRRTKKSRRARNHPNSHLSFEPLEERHMLTVYTVTQSSDTGSISTPNTLSWAIDQVNTHPGGLQEIRFSILGGGGTVNVTGVNGLVPNIKHALTTIDGTDSVSGLPVRIHRPSGSVFNALTYDGNFEGAGKLTIRDLEISGFQANAILIQSLGDGDQVEIENTVLHGNGSAGISSFDIATGSDGWISIHDNWIYGNGGDAISIVSPIGTIPSTSAIRNSITGNTIGRTTGGAASGNGGHGITLGQNAARFDVTNNAIENVTTSGRDAIRRLRACLKSAICERWVRA